MIPANGFTMDVARVGGDGTVTVRLDLLPWAWERIEKLAHSPELAGFLRGIEAQGGDDADIAAAIAEAIREALKDPPSSPENDELERMAAEHPA